MMTMRFVNTAEILETCMRFFWSLEVKGSLKKKYLFYFCFNVIAFFF